jgi:branched-chain amino acid transport system ATP-binding protein
MRSIMGIVAKRTGSIRLRREGDDRPASINIARLGIAYCPEERGIFSSLNVDENLTLPPDRQAGGLSLDEIFTLFPNLKERRYSQGTKLSGGEQQMLAIGRILRTGATLLLLDEPTEGFAPVIVQRIGEIIRQLKQPRLHHPAGRAELPFRGAVADRHYVMEDGRWSTWSLASELAGIQPSCMTYLGV